MKLPRELRDEIYSYLPDVTTIHIRSSYLQGEIQPIIGKLNSRQPLALAYVNRELKSEVGLFMKQHIKIDVEHFVDIFYLEDCLEKLPPSFVAHIKSIEFYFNVDGGTKIHMARSDLRFNVSILFTTAPSCEIVVSSKTLPKYIRQYLHRHPRCCKGEERGLSYWLEDLPYHATHKRRVFTGKPFALIGEDINRLFNALDEEIEGMAYARYQMLYKRDPVDRIEVDIFF